MGLILIWIGFVIFISISEKLTQPHYLLFSSFMLYFTYAYQSLTFQKIPFRVLITLLTIPATILWYTAFVYNDFLCLNPITYELFVSLMFIYIYLMIYIFIEYTNNL